MKQLGNLSIAYTKRRNLVLLLQNGKVSVLSAHDKQIAKWDGDDAISRIVHTLNFGEYSEAAT